MSVVKSAIGSLIGAAIGVAVYFGIQKTTGQTYIWFPLVIGVLTGIVARMLAGGARSNAARFAGGALAGLIAGAAILGIDFVPTLMAAKPEFGPIELKDRVAAASDLKVERMKSDEKMVGDDTMPDTDANQDDEQESDNDEMENEKVGGTSQDESGEMANDDADDAGDLDSDLNADNQGAETESPDNAMDMMKRERTPGPNTPNNSEANTKRFAEIIKKQSHQTWYDFVLPHVFTGLGMLIAYQVVRGFGASSPKK